MQRAPGEFGAQERQVSAIKKSALKTSRARSNADGKAVSFSSTLEIIRFQIDDESKLGRRNARWKGSHIRRWGKVGRVYFGEVRGSIDTPSHRLTLKAKELKVKSEPGLSEDDQIANSCSSVNTISLEVLSEPGPCMFFEV